MPTIRLTYRSGGDERSLIIERPTSFGRTATEADHVLDDPRTSRRHFLIEPHEQGALLVDLGSSNGTLVNGVRVEQAFLRHGDRLQAGDTEFAVAFLTLPAQASAPPPDAHARLADRHRRGNPELAEPNHHG